jgi:hypothetical protein
MPLEVDERELLSPHLTYSRFRYSTDTSHYNRGKPALQTSAVSQQSAQKPLGLAIFSISDAGTRLPRICRKCTVAGEITIRQGQVLRLASGGIDVFVVRTAQRILDEHKNKIVLNNCPRCGALAKTPKARQCRFLLMRLALCQKRRIIKLGVDADKERWRASSPDPFRRNSS